MFPNAVRMKQVEGPDHTVIPVFNIVFQTLLTVLALRLLWVAARDFGIF